MAQASEKDIVSQVAHTFGPTTGLAVAVAIEIASREWSDDDLKTFGTAARAEIDRIAISAVETQKEN